MGDGYLWKRRGGMLILLRLYVSVETLEYVQEHPNLIRPRDINGAREAKHHTVVGIPRYCQPAFV